MLARLVLSAEGGEATRLADGVRASTVRMARLRLPGPQLKGVPAREAHRGATGPVALRQADQKQGS